LTPGALLSQGVPQLGGVTPPSWGTPCDINAIYLYIGERYI